LARIPQNYYDFLNVIELVYTISTSAKHGSQLTYRQDHTPSEQIKYTILRYTYAFIVRGLQV